MKKKLIVIMAMLILLGVSSFTPLIYDIQQKNNRILLCISSFKRPIFLSGQIFRLLNQTYNADISVSVKGGDPKDFESTFQKEYDVFEKTNRVKIRYDENRGQLSNLLDTVRDVDLKKYDYFCKIDDDDWYAPDYVEHVNKAINDAPEGIASVRTFRTRILTENIEKVQIRDNGTNLCGPTLCFSRKVIQRALEMEKHPELVTYYLPGLTPAYFHRREDRVLDHLALEMGGSFAWKYGDPKVVFGWQYRSVMRNQNYVK